MPRIRADGVTPDWQQLRAMAGAQDGYFSLRDASRHGIGRQLLQHHVGAGGVRRIGRGAFQLAHFTPAVNEDCVAAWLWSEGEGVLSHETALRLHGLIDERPAHVHLTLPPSWRRLRLQPPVGVALHFHEVSEEHREGRAPLRWLALDDALLSAAAWSSEPALVEAAFVRVLEKGLRERWHVDELLQQNFDLRRALQIPFAGIPGAL